MTNYFYTRLAIINIKNNKQSYVPYLITITFTIAMFYIIHAISLNNGLNEIVGSSSLKEILKTGTWIIGIFSTIFLFYTNSFLIKRRKQEIGLYNVLGLGKKHIRRMLFVESIIISTSGMLCGLLVGILLNKLMFALLLRLLQFPVPFGFFISIKSIYTTIILFTVIFITSYLYNIMNISVSKPVELLKGGQVGEKEPKSNWVVAIIGFVSLAAGYFIALTVDNPLQAITVFFPTVVLVMVGTYCIFSAGSIVVLKQLRKNKKLYYRTENFITISGLLYRMKQNAIGLANICILSTAVLITLSSTTALYIGMEDVLRTRYPREIVIEAVVADEETVNTLDWIVSNATKENGVILENKFSFQCSSVFLDKSNDNFQLMAKDNFSINNSLLLTIISIDDYNNMEKTNISLSDTELIVISPYKSYKKDTMTINDTTYKIIEETNKIFGEKMKLDIAPSYIVIVNDIKTFNDQVYQGYENDGADFGSAFNNSKDIDYNILFDIAGSDEDTIKLANNIEQLIETSNINDYTIENAPINKSDFFSLYGGLFFIGIFIGSLFLIATVLIIYYKQISEGFDDKERFVIMQNVGLSKQEVKDTIKKQILTVFFLPLVFAVLHVTVAFPILIKILRVLNLHNWHLYLIATITTIVIFGIVYALIYSLTARTYYKIIES